MSEIKIKSVPVVAVQEVAVCSKTPKCKGELIFMGTGSTVGMTTVYEHRCSKCGEIHLAMGVYPRIVHQLAKSTKRTTRKARR